MSRKGYDVQLRQKLVAKVLAGESIGKTAKDAGVSYSALKNWVDKETKGWYSEKNNCPRCGAIPSHQRYRERVVRLDETRAVDMNPVDGFICPYCQDAFRVSRLESEAGYIIDWQTEYEFPPHFCPNCGASLKGKLSTDLQTTHGASFAYLGAKVVDA